jgi:hypothetical protein
MLPHVKSPHTSAVCGAHYMSGEMEITHINATTMLNAGTHFSELA